MVKNHQPGYNLLGGKLLLHSRARSCARKLMRRGAHHGFCIDGETVPGWRCAEDGDGWICAESRVSFLGNHHGSEPYKVAEVTPLSPWLFTLSYPVSLGMHIQVGNLDAHLDGWTANFMTGNPGTSS